MKLSKYVLAFVGCIRCCFADVVPVSCLFTNDVSEYPEIGDILAQYPEVEAVRRCDFGTTITYQVASPINSENGVRFFSLDGVRRNKFMEHEWEYDLAGTESHLDRRDIYMCGEDSPCTRYDDARFVRTRDVTIDDFRRFKATWDGVLASEDEFDSVFEELPADQAPPPHVAGLKAAYFDSGSRPLLRELDIVENVEPDRNLFRAILSQGGGSFWVLVFNYSADAFEAQYLLYAQP